jgi:hypothetical protein
MQNSPILKLLNSDKKLQLTIVSTRDPVDESGYIRYSEPMMTLDDDTTRQLLQLALTGIKATEPARG